MRGVETGEFRELVVVTPPGTAATAVLPLVVLLHGRGSDPSRFREFFRDYNQPARFVYLEAPVDEGDGRGWFSFRGKSSEELVTELRNLAQRIADQIETLRARYPSALAPVLVGFSQGGMLTWVVALEHEGIIRRAVVVGGTLWDAFVPTEAPQYPLPPIFVLHGEADPVIPVERGLRNVEHLERLGVVVKAETFRGVPHWISGEMKDALHDAVSQ